VRNLRLIIQGYLEAAYQYSAQDAALLAEYITVYNAVYRGTWAYFEQRYKSAVVQHLEAGKVGLSIRFDEWPGQTLMLIPLGRGSSGSLSAIDTSAVSDTNVLDEMRKEEDRGIEQRQEMADLKDREAQEVEQKAQVQREAIAEEEQKISQEREDVSQERERIAEERQQTRQAAASGEISREEARQQEEALAARETAVETKEQELEQREEALVEQREEVRREEEWAEQKREEARQDRESIARDQWEMGVEEQGEEGPQDRQEAESVVREEGSRAESPREGSLQEGSPREESSREESQGTAEGSGLIGAILEKPDSSLGRVARVNPVTGAEIRRSGTNTVNGRTLAFVGGRLLALAGETRGNGAIRLVEIDLNSLEIVSRGNDDIHPSSLLWVNGMDLYAIVSSEGGAYLGRFDVLLSRQAISETAVHPFASVNFQNGLLVTQRADGSILILNPRELTED
jgi:hypothetical protein